jgi:hypothetical protein
MLTNYSQKKFNEWPTLNTDEGGKIIFTFTEFEEITSRGASVAMISEIVW